MGILADFFVATPKQAARYARSIEEPDEGEEIRSILRPCQYKGITGLELGTLWAILEGVTWIVEKHMPEDTMIGEDGEWWLNRFPNALTHLLAQASEDELARVGIAWAQTDELACDPSDISPVLNELHGLALRALSLDQSVYLWGSL